MGTRRPAGKVSFGNWTTIRAMAAEGKSTDEIAAKLNLSPKTVAEVASYRKDGSDNG